MTSVAVAATCIAAKVKTSKMDDKCRCSSKSKQLCKWRYSGPDILVKFNSECCTLTCIWEGCIQTINLCGRFQLNDSFSVSVLSKIKLTFEKYIFLSTSILYKNFMYFIRLFFTVGGGGVLKIWTYRFSGVISVQLYLKYWKLMRNELFVENAVVMLVGFCVFGQEVFFYTGFGSTRKITLVLWSHSILSLLSSKWLKTFLSFHFFVTCQLCHGCYAINTFLCNLLINQQINKSEQDLSVMYAYSTHLSPPPPKRKKPTPKTTLWQHWWEVLALKETTFLKHVLSNS